MMKKVRRKYTREFKLEALRLLETSGKSASQIVVEFLHLGSGVDDLVAAQFVAVNLVALDDLVTPDQIPIPSVYAPIHTLSASISHSPSDT
jgi:hypothetical protein